MKNNNTRELNFNFIERQPIATEAYLLLLFGSADQEKIKEKMLEVYRELYENDEEIPKVGEYNIILDINCV